MYITTCGGLRGLFALHVIYCTPRTTQNFHVGIKLRYIFRFIKIYCGKEVRAPLEPADF